jgi:hypothetical protein
MIKEPDSFFSSAWMHQHATCPISVSVKSDTGEGFAATLSADAILLPNPLAEGTFTLVPVDRKNIHFLDGSEIDDVDNVPNGIYAMLPLQMDSAITVTSRSPGLLGEMRKFAVDQGLACVPFRLLICYVDILR